MGQLRMLRGSLATAKEGNIRGRLHLKTSNVLMVGSSVLLAPSLSDGLVLRERPDPLPRAGFPPYGRLNAHLVRVPRGLLCAAE